MPRPQPSAAGSTTAAEPGPATTVSVEQFSTGFAEQTGIELTASDFPGETVLLETGGDPDQIFDVVTGKGRDEASLRLDEAVSAVVAGA